MPVKIKDLQERFATVPSARRAVPRQKRPSTKVAKQFDAAHDAVAKALSHVVGEVDTSDRRRAEYSTDASNYRVPPAVVVFPQSITETLDALATLRELPLAVTARGGGTSVAGNAVGPGAVFDFSRHLNRVLSIDAEAKTAVVEPGCVMSVLQQEAKPHGLRFGPDPSTQNRATLAGMIGNNACGPHAVAWGRTADNVVSLDVVDGTGRRFTAGRGDAEFTDVPGLKEFVENNLAIIRTEFGRFNRQVSGYSLEHLLPENGSDLAKALVGTEGTCVTVLEATVNLVELPTAPTLVVLGYADMPSAADAVPGLLAITGDGAPLAIEGLDARLVDVVKRVKGEGSVPDLPQGFGTVTGWLMVEVSGASAEEARGYAEEVVRCSGALDSTIIPAGPDATRMWNIRADGAGLAGRTLKNKQAWPGWEDSAVPPENLGAYLRDLDALMERFGVEGMPFGHFGDGCIHLRLDFPLDHGAEEFRGFLLEAAAQVSQHGGSMSGEHGDGRARSELLPAMYSPQAIALLEQFKALFDPQNLLNPGVVVNPAPVDADLRRPYAHTVRSCFPVGEDGGEVAGKLTGMGATTGAAGFAFHEDHGDLTVSAHRCVGVGKCRADYLSEGGFMCPSYRATKDEKDVTRGRSRVLQEAVNGRLIHGLASAEVREALDLCMACKACSADCPAGVDIARMKSEVLFRSYSGKPRPIDHYILGWLPRWTRLLTSLGPLVNVINAVLAIKPIGWLVLKVGGMDTRRALAPFSDTPFRKRWKKGTDPEVAAAKAGATPEDHGVGLASSSQGMQDYLLGDLQDDSSTASVRDPQHRDAQPRDPQQRDRRVVLWTDSFSDGIAPQVPLAAVKVLTAAGYHVIVPDKEACCGLTWITTGQLDGARKRLERLLGILGPYAVNGIPIMGLEPSCTAVLRSDLLDLFPDDPRAHAVAKATHTLAELLTDPATAPPADEFTVPDLSDLSAIVQPHCHHYSVLGFDPDEKLLRDAGATVKVLQGCCGLAGNFGMQKGHYELSVAVGEAALLPALRERSEGDQYLADGFSCRTQAVQLAGVEGKALVEIIAERL